jgi:PmbA protein
MESSKKDLLEQTISLAKKKGINSCDVILSEGKSFNLSVQNNDIDSYKVSGSNTIGIRVIKDNKVGLSYSEELSKEAVEIMIDKAIANSEFSRVNEFEGIENESQEERIHSEKKSEEVNAEKLIELGKKLEADMKLKDKLIAAVPYNGVSESESSAYYMNSNGSFCFDEGYHLSCYTSALIKDGDKNSLHYHGALSNKFSKLDYDRCIEESYKHAKAWVDASSLSSGKYPVIFSVNQLDSLVGAFQGIFSAKSRMEKNNPMSDSLGKEIFHKDITIIDAPKYESSLFKTPFDSEGYSSQDLTLMENGVLSSFLHNSVTAKNFNEENNFRASRGARSSLGVSGTNIIIKEGKSSVADLHKGKYLKIYSMQGLHSGLNFMSGDFSFGASGYLMDGEEIIQAVNGITVAGNFYQMMKEIDGLGTELKANSSYNFFSPEIRFSNLTVAGDQ